MAILSKIRQRSILLVLIIALALFSFVLADVIKSGGFQGSNDIGSINGTKFEYQEFMSKVANVEKQQQGVSNTQALNSVWEQEVRKAILTEQYDKIGLLLGRDQLMAVLKPQLIQDPKFLNAAGQFDDKKFSEYINSLQSAPDQTQWNMWKSYEVQIEDVAKEQIYNTLIKSSVYTTKAEGRLKYERDNNKVDFDYVALAYSTVSDDQVKVTDEDIIAYMKKSPKKFKYDNTRSIEYVLIENKPSAADEAAMKSKMDGFVNGKTEMVNGVNETIPSFASATNLADYVNKYSEIKFDSTYLAKKQMNPQFAEQLFGLAPGQVYGPYTDADGYSKLSRVAGRKSNVSGKVSHILVAYKGSERAAATITLTKEQAKAKAEGLLTQVNANPGNIGMLAMTNSDDPSAKQNGGVFDDITPESGYTQAFKDFLFKNPVGKTGVVETEFGFHVMKVEAKNDAVLLATVALKIQPSDKTDGINFNKSLKVEADAIANGIDKAAKTAGLKIAPVASVRAYDENVANLGLQRQIVTWAFNKETNIDDIKRFDIANVGFAVVKLKAKNDDGLLPLDLARQSVEALIKNEKKAAILKKKMTGTTLEAISKSTGSSISPAVGVTMASPMVPNLGYEPKVIGAAIGLGSGKTSKVIEGNSGLFMVRTKGLTKAPAVNDYKAQIDQLNMQTKGSAPFRLVQGLKDKADIVDNRGRF